jgi:hypothetical protein
MVIPSRETAAFNLAMPYLQRVNGVLNSNYTAFKNADKRTFAINLRQLYRELRPWLESSKKNDETAGLKKLFKDLSEIKNDDTEKIWDKMEEIEMEMRIHFKALGMLMPKLTDPRFLFGNKQK